MSLLFTLSRFKEGEELKYLADAGNLIRPERNTLLVNFQDVEEHSTKLATIIQEHYYQYVSVQCIIIMTVIPSHLIRGSHSLPLLLL